MTRQKTEIINKIQEIEEWIAVDNELGCGFAPSDFYSPLYEQIHELEEQLAKLRHYANAEDMYLDKRYMNAHRNAEELPFE